VQSDLMQSIGMNKGKTVKHSPVANNQTVPKYQTVHDELLGRIDAGMYSVGTRLPTEDALSKTFKVSRVTVRKALELLVHAGYLTSRQGSGYIVSTLSPPSSTCLVSFTDQVLTEGRIPGARLIGIERHTDDLPATVQSLFDEPLVLVRRVRTVDGKPRLLTLTWIPERLVQGLSVDDFPETGQNQSILRILMNRFGLEWKRACETVDSVIASPEIAAHLGIQSNVAILSQACTAFDRDDNPVFFDQVYREGPINFDLTGGSPQKTGA
tara:strand:- start:16440 stop:17243 length:804 start_codon:yes stop_codon:yes gene_type:complete